MTVKLSQALSSATTITLCSSSASGRFATSPSGPWSSSLTLSVPAGSTTSAAFYYSDTHAGQPLLTASASGYTNATQTETVRAGALASIAISPANSQVRVGGHESLSATGQDGFGNPVSVSPVRSVSPALGTFSPNPGNPVRFAAKSTGSGTVTATVGAHSGRTTITVTRRSASLSARVASVSRPNLRTFLSRAASTGCIRGGLLVVAVHKRQLAGLVSLHLLVDGKDAGTLHGRWLTNGASIYLSPPTSHTVTLVDITRDGHRFSATYRYRACAAPSQGGGAKLPTILPALAGG
jgi:hypothetical protein